jgi:hypothetical protein
MGDLVNTTILYANVEELGRLNEVHARADARSTASPIGTGQGQPAPRSAGLIGAVAALPLPWS